MLRGAPRLISLSSLYARLPQRSLPLTLPPPAGRRRRVFVVFNVHYKGQTPRLHGTCGPGVDGNTRWRTLGSRDGDGVGSVGIVCICFCAFTAPVDCQRAETVRTKHHPSLLSSHLHNFWLYLLLYIVEMFGVGRCEVSVTLHE